MSKNYCLSLEKNRIGKNLNSFMKMKDIMQKLHFCFNDVISIGNYSANNHETYIPNVFKLGGFLTSLAKYKKVAKQPRLALLKSFLIVDSI